MTPRQKQRMWIVITIVIGAGVAAVLGLKAFQANITYFLNPSDVASGNYDINNRYRVGGIVKPGSISRLDDGVTVQFSVTDCDADVIVQYTGILPDLFREGQGIVANGKLNQQAVLVASQVLAKHDENYVPTEAAEAVMKAQAEQCNTTDAVSSK